MEDDLKKNGKQPKINNIKKMEDDLKTIIENNLEKKWKTTSSRL
jgi:hypothetical protein